MLGDCRHARFGLQQVFGKDSDFHEKKERFDGSFDLGGWLPL